MNIGFFYDFRPIGQGLFAVGRLARQRSDGTNEHFTWVHDCGSETLTTTTFTNETSAMSSILENRLLDMLVLSHFDNDHISGLILLLGQCRVQRLVIPYFTPIERLLILFATEAASLDLQRFLAGPVGFVRSLQGGQEVEIILIGRSGDEPLGGLPDTGGNPNDRGPVDLGPKRHPSKDDEEKDADLGKAVRSYGVTIKDNNLPMDVWGCWEFCFLNLPPHEVAKKATLDELWRKVKPDFDKFHQQETTGSEQAALVQNMKKSYRDVFGTSDKARNDLSLVTYTGPAKENLGIQGISDNPGSLLYLAGATTRPKCVLPVSSQLLQACFDWTEPFGWRTSFCESKVSLLYTGDICLTVKRTNEIKRLLTDERWGRIEVLQVPHHGAESSWKGNLGVIFTHRYSVFSSARYHAVYRHPRPEVLEDLRNTRCILVNEHVGAVFHGTAHWM